MYTVNLKTMHTLLQPSSSLIIIKFHVNTLTFHLYAHILITMSEKHKEREVHYVNPGLPKLLSVLHRRLLSECAK